MVSKKQIKLIFSGLVLVLSFFAIVLTDEPPRLSKSFEKEPQGQISEDVYEEEVLGQSVLVSEEPDSKSNFIEEEAGGTIEAESEQVEESGFKVVKVVDGDTIDLEIEGEVERLRLIGIDTPETVDPRKSVQCFGKEASNKAWELLEGQFVTLESDETQGDRDKYKRLLRYVFLPDGTNFNLYMIAEGYAHEYTYDEPYKYQSEFKQAEIDARNASKGLWSSETCSGNS